MNIRRFMLVIEMKDVDRESTSSEKKSVARSNKVGSKLAVVVEEDVSRKGPGVLRWKGDFDKVLLEPPDELGTDYAFVR